MQSRGGVESRGIRVQPAERDGKRIRDTARAGRCNPRQNHGTLLLGNLDVHAVARGMIRVRLIVAIVSVIGEWAIGEIVVARAFRAATVAVFRTGIDAKRTIALHAQVDRPSAPRQELGRHESQN